MRCLEHIERNTEEQEEGVFEIYGDGYRPLCVDPKDGKTNTEAEKCYTNVHGVERSAERRSIYSSGQFVNTNSRQHPKNARCYRGR